MTRDDVERSYTASVRRRPPSARVIDHRTALRMVASRHDVPARAATAPSRIGPFRGPRPQTLTLLRDVTGTRVDSPREVVSRSSDAAAPDHAGRRWHRVARRHQLGAAPSPADAPARTGCNDASRGRRGCRTRGTGSGIPPTRVEVLTWRR